MRRNLSYSSITWLRVLYLSEIKVTTKLSLIKVLSKLVDSLYVEVSSVGMNSATWLNLIIGEVIISHEAETRLCNRERVRNLPSL